MTNERLTQISTTMYQDAGTTTLEEFIFHAKRDFESRVLSLYQMTIDDNQKNFVNKEQESRYKRVIAELSKSIYSTGFYHYFDHIGVDLQETQMFPIYHFRINPKNINFETTITNLRETFSGMTIYPDSPEVCTSSETHLRYIKDIPDWESLFGKGEFPFMTIYVFRLGNTEYFAYEIHR